MMAHKRIPALIGVLLIVGGALAGVLVVKNGTDFLPRAAPEYIPQKIKVTNISDTGFTISWLTQEPTIGFIKLGTDPQTIDTTVVDERDQLTGESGQYRTHYVSVLGLEPKTTYSLKLGSHAKRLYDNEGQPLTVATGPVLGESPPADTAYGTVLTPAETPAEGAIVYLTFDSPVNATPLSTLVKQNGNWALSLSTARTQDLVGYAVYDPQNTPLNLLVRASLTEEASVLADTGNDQPIPQIMLGQTQDFRSPVNSIEPTPAESKFSLLPLTVTEPDEEASVKILTPASDTAVVTQTQPQIVGVAPPGTTLTVTIHSNQIYTDTVYTDETGSWSWVPPGELAPGNHTVTISYSDEAGILHSVSRSFVVASAQASAVDTPVYSASPSAQLSPTQPPQPTNVPTRVPDPTPIPTSVISPTPAPTVLPPAGSVTQTVTLLTLGLITFTTGGLWLFLRQR